jgi:hypothetical protein
MESLSSIGEIRAQVSALLDEIEADSAALQRQAHALACKCRLVRSLLDGTDQYAATYDSEVLFSGLVCIYESEPVILAGVVGLRDVVARL